ncbi:hypothetical protein DMO24_16485 [Modestobacter versicolor]|uniref:Uncharacterized protein n=1 Tax=Modestobacter versicolor TaxID=429133 RepID=A0A323V6S2_9ACTN|nr:hypothetical protein DMO24_16485 [Modestobacter versicolor]
MTGAVGRSTGVPLPQSQQCTGDAAGGGGRDGQHWVGAGGRRPQPERDEGRRPGQDHAEHHAALQRQDDGGHGEHQHGRPGADPLEQETHHHRVRWVATGVGTATSGCG